MLYRKLFLFLMIIGPGAMFSQTTNGDDFNCFTILVGKEASFDESVLMAHNEDDYGDQIVNWIAVPALDHPSGEMIMAVNGAAIPQVSHTHRYIWIDMPGMSFSDSYMNEFGVTIASNSCPSREDSAVLTEGGITWQLRQIMAQRATSARAAVNIATQLINQYGYAASGRTYSIADPNEAWMLSVVAGKHYVALRIPDHAVAPIPNYYTIADVNMADTANCIASPDLIEYAIKRGWHKRDSPVRFNFRKVYGSQQSLNHPVNIKRMWEAVNNLSSNYYELDQEFPWLIYPSRKITVEWLSNILSSHYEGTPLDITEGYTIGNPHDDQVDGICSGHTQYGFVAQLRNWMPADVGALMWMMPRRPCVQAMIPIYCGLNSFPADFSMYPYDKAIEKHFNKPVDLKQATPDHVYWQFSRVADSADSNYLGRSRQIGPEALKFNRELIEQQETFELDVLTDWVKYKEKATQRLNRKTEETATQWLKKTDEILIEPAPKQ